MLGTILRTIGLLLALGGAATIIAITINNYITAREIAKQAKEQAPKKGLQAIKAMVKSKNTKKVDIGLFNSSNEEVQQMTIESSKGVSNDLYVGQEIYI